MRTYCLQSANGEAASPAPTPTGSRKGSWSLRGRIATGDAPDAGKSADGGQSATTPPAGSPTKAARDSADGSSPTKAAMRAATAATGKVPGAGPVSAAGAAQPAAAEEEELQPRNLDEELPPPKDLDAAAAAPQEQEQRHPDAVQRPSQRRSEEQQHWAAPRDLDQLAREAQVLVAVLLKGRNYLAI